MIKMILNQFTKVGEGQPYLNAILRKKTSYEATGAIVSDYFVKTQPYERKMMQRKTRVIIPGSLMR